jgi:uncharacterized protein YbaR (Trm112 family)
MNTRTVAEMRGRERGRGTISTSPAPCPNDPHSEECERAVLGAILLEPQLAGDVDLRPEDFYLERHKRIFAALLHVHAAGTGVDHRTVQARLEDLGQLDAVGGTAYLAGLDGDLPAIGGFRSYMGIVQERSHRRQLLEAANQTIHDGRNHGLETPILVDRLAATLEKIRSRASGDQPEAIDVEDFLALELQPRQWLAEGLIQDRDILMLHATRGCGKSHFCFGLAYSLACGVDFLQYKIRESVPVLLCDGEQQSEDIQARLRAIEASLGRAPVAPFLLLARDQVGHLPSLATAQGQVVVDRNLAKLPTGPRVLVIDSLSTLAPLPEGVSENDEAGWRPIQEWLLRLRGLGVTSMFSHHDNRTGGPRGTSARETLPSQMVHLTRPKGYSASEGARFVVSLEKARGVHGQAARSFEAWLQTGPDGHQVWTIGDLEDRKDEAIRAALAAGITSQRQIARNTGIPFATVNRRLKRLGMGRVIR